jgi:hypothetical protein
MPTPGAKKVKPLPGREQQAGGPVGLIPSVKQPRCRRGPALGQPGCCRCGSFFIQVSEYLVDQRRVFDAGNDAHITAAFTAAIGYAAD